MPERADYSGPFDPEIQFEDFSKDFLVKVMTHWHYAYIKLATIFYNEIRERYGIEVANDINYIAWTQIGEKVYPRHAKMGNIELKDVLDSLKCVQLHPDNNVMGSFPCEYDIRDNNYVLMTVKQCPSLLYYEKHAPEMIEPICHVMEPAVFQKYVINQKVKVTPLKLPPRKSPEDPACLWEFKMQS